MLNHLIERLAATRARQASWPAGRWSVLAGFVEPGESLVDAMQPDNWIYLHESGREMTGAELRHPAIDAQKAAWPCD